MNRQVQTIFCDDIRQEISGKQSFIGVYSGKMLVPSFPIILPKLCLALTISTPVEQPFRKVAIKLLRDEETLVEGDIPESDLSALVGMFNTSESDTNGRVAIIHSQIVISPFQVDAPCILRVRATTEESELKGIGLRIELAPS